MALTSSYVSKPETGRYMKLASQFSDETNKCLIIWLNKPWHHFPLSEIPLPQTPACAGLKASTEISNLIPIVIKTSYKNNKTTQMNIISNLIIKLNINGIFIFFYINKVNFKNHLNLIYVHYKIRKSFELSLICNYTLEILITDIISNQTSKIQTFTDVRSLNSIRFDLRSMEINERVVENFSFTEGIFYSNL